MDLIKAALTNTTVWANIVAFVASWLATKYAITVTPDQQAALVGGIMVAVNVVVEHLTTGLAKPSNPNLKGK